MKKLTEYTDREIALMMGSLYQGICGKREALIAEAAYRLVRAGGPAMDEEQAELVEEIQTYAFRLREASRKARRKKTAQAVRPVTPARVISIR